VYVHCCSSVTRAPSVIITYMCLYVKVKDWDNPAKVASLVKDFHKVSFPNMSAVHSTIN